MDNKEIIKAASEALNVGSDEILNQLKNSQPIPVNEDVGFAEIAALSKPWYLSRTIAGGAIAIGAAIAGVFGLHIDAAVQTSILNYAVEIGAGLGGLVAIWGRIKATHQIGGR